MWSWDWMRRAGLMERLTLIEGFALTLKGFFPLIVFGLFFLLDYGISWAEAPQLFVLYDNFPYDRRLTPGWGFSCLVKGVGQTVLFDTGADGERLLRHMAVLRIDPGEVDLVVISHLHGDHTGGLGAFLRANPRVKVFLPGSSPEGFRQEIERLGARVLASKGPVEVCQGVWTTGELGGWIREQGLILEVPRGFVLITGCAHPGVLHMAKRVKELKGRVPFFVLGGFHLFAADAEEIKPLASALKALGVEFVGPCHCSGEEARKIFRRVFGEGYVEMGVGRVLDLDELGGP